MTGAPSMTLMYQRVSRLEIWSEESPVFTTAAIGAPVTGLLATSLNACTIWACTNSDMDSCGRQLPGSRVMLNSLTGSKREGDWVSWMWMSEVCPMYASDRLLAARAGAGLDATRSSRTMNGSPGAVSRVRYARFPVLACRMVSRRVVGTSAGVIGAASALPTIDVGSPTEAARAPLNAMNDRRLMCAICSPCGRLHVIVAQSRPASWPLARRVGRLPVTNRSMWRLEVGVEVEYALREAVLCAIAS